MLSKSPVGVAFLGVGDIATLHADALRRSTCGKLVGVWNHKEKDISSGGHIVNVHERCKAFGAKKVFKTLDDVWNDREVEAVFILTPLQTHLQLAKEALQHGKHVLVEKPVAATASEIDELIHFSQKHNRVCMPGHNCIYDPQLVRMRESIAQGRLGTLVHVSVMYNIHHNDEVAARLVGVMDQTMTHHSYIARFLLGSGEDADPVAVQCLASSVGSELKDRESTAVILTKVKAGTIVVLEGSFAADDHSAEPWSFSVKVIGTKGAARYSYNDIVVNEKHTIHSHTYDAFPNSVYEEVQYFLEKCVREGKPPLSTLEDARAGVLLLQTAKVHAKL